MTMPDLDAVADIVRLVCREEMMPRFRQLAADEIREKGPGDLVTVVDEACEARYTALLTDLLPGSVILGEEGASKDPSRFGVLDGDDPVWVIDPLDGTSNFAHGRDRFGSIVALVIGGETVAGWVHDPVRDRMAITERGSGATLDGVRGRVSESSQLSALHVLLTEKFFPAEHRPAVPRIRAAVAHLRGFYCAALEYIALLSGEADVALPSKLMPWDHAAGVLMHAEAGGVNRMLGGGRYRPYPATGLLIIAPSDPVIDALAALVLNAEAPAA